MSLSFLDFAWLCGLLVLSFHCRFESPVNHTSCFSVSPWVFVVWIFFLFCNLRWIILLGDRSKWCVTELVIRVLDTLYPVLFPSSFHLSLAFYWFKWISFIVSSQARCSPSFFLRWLILMWLVLISLLYFILLALYSLIIQACSRIFAFRCIVIFEEFEKWKKSIGNICIWIAYCSFIFNFWIKSQKLQKISLSFLLPSCNFISSYLQGKKKIKLALSSYNLLWNSFYTHFLLFLSIL